MILTGDSLDVLKTLGSDSVDLVCTDPPYGYSFMGKDWDKAVPSVEIWQECLRVLKPGAFCFVMSAPRSDVQNAMISRLMEAGFRLDFTPIYWTYASGFPKAGNIGKLVDKRLGVEREVLGKTKSQGGCSGGNNEFGVALANIPKEMNITKPATPQAKALDGSYAGFQPKPAVEVIIVAMKPLSEKTYVDQALANGHGVTWLDDCRVPTSKQETVDRIKWNKYANKDYDNNGTGYGEIMTKTGENDLRGRFPANLIVSDDVLNDGTDKRSGGVYNQSPRKTGGYGAGVGLGTMSSMYADSGSYSRYFDLDKWSTTLPFLIVPKASKREKNEGLNKFNCAIIDVCQDVNTEQVTSLLKDILESIPSSSIVVSGLQLTVRFPMDTMSTTLTTINQITDLKTYTLLMQSPTRESMRVALSKMTHGTSPANFVESSSESTKITGTLAKRVGLVTDAVSNAIYQRLLTLKDSDAWKLNSNIHPTCKPTKLMSYLITLASRPGDTVLDPFVGSGTTVIAAKHLGRNGIGIEREAEYAEIAKARLAHITPQLPPEEPVAGVPPVTLDNLPINTQASLF